MAESMRVTELSLLPLTRNKEKMLDDFRQRYLKALNLTLKFLTFCQPMTDNELHSISYTSVRKETGLPSQIVQTARREVWSKERIMFRVEFKSVCARLTTRDYRFDKTKRGNPLFAITLSKGKRFCMPIRKDGGWQRFNSFLKDGWNFKSIMLLEKSGSWVFQATLKKEFPEPIRGKSILGVDVGSATLAAISVIQDKRILRQLYLGREISHRQRLIEIRRAKLTSLADRGSHRAGQSLTKLKSYETDYIKTECFKTAWQIIRLAKEFNSSIAIEKLANCRTRKGQFSKESNRKVNKIPYYKLFSAIKSIAVRECIEVIEVDPRNTSRTCYKCGSVAKSNRRIQALFKCKCGHTCNADRNASVNIALRADGHAIQTIVGSAAEAKPQRTPRHSLGCVQIPQGRMPVNASLRSNDRVVSMGLKSHDMPESHQRLSSI